MQYIRLGDIASIAAGQGAPQGAENYSEYGTPFVKAGNLAELTSGTSEDAIQKVSDEVAAKHKLKLFPQGTVLFAKSGMSCMKGYVYTLSRDCYVVSHLACITPHTVESEYLKYYFEFHRPNQLVKDAAYPSISLSDIAELPIAVFDQEKRQEIIHNLDVVSGLFEKKQQILSLMDLAVKSRFIELFGDPIANQFGWDTTNIGAIVTEVRYGTSRPAVENGKYPYLRMNNLTFDGHLDLKDLKRIDIPEEEIEKCIVRKGDVLFNRTNSVELVGKTCVFDLDEEMVIAGYIIRVRLGQKMIPTVFSAFMNSQPIKELFRGMAKGAVNQANINAQELQSIRIYLPPIDLQEQFAAFVEQTDKSKFFACQTLSFLLKLANNLQSWREKQYDY